MKKFNYENNQYLRKLNELPVSYYSKYIKYVKITLKNSDDKFLDIGCGNGVILNQLKKEGFKNGYGVDISKLFIKEAKKNGLKNVYVYDGINFPFKKESFNLVGSFNVLEHVEDPEKFLKYQIKLLKKKGFIIVACPNFFSPILTNRQERLKGKKNKLINLLLIFKKIIEGSYHFEMMEPVKNKKFEYDDDAIVVTNLIDLRKCLESNRCRVVYMSGFINYDTNIYKIINYMPLIRYLLPSCFIVAQKK